MNRYFYFSHFSHFKHSFLGEGLMNYQKLFEPKNMAGIEEQPR